MTLKADKLVGGKPEPMYEIDFAYRPARRAWVAEFTPRRVHAEWVYRVRGRSMTGTLVEIPSGRVFRDIRVRKD
ncbi:MAG: hypothetical protein JO040_04220 [Gemmatimonadetes bacterium]|nr:hypothetical protein [Gemmatimonadota bacterium]